MPPVYEYRCASCGCQFAVTQKVNDPEPTAAPICAGSGCRIEKLFGRINTIVVGKSAAPVAEAIPLSTHAIDPPKPEASHICSKYCEHHK